MNLLNIEEGFLNFIPIAHLAKDLDTTNCEHEYGDCPGCKLQGIRRGGMYVCCQSIHFCFLCRHMIFAFQILQECLISKDITRLVATYAFTREDYVYATDVHYGFRKPRRGGRQL